MLNFNQSQHAWLGDWLGWRQKDQHYSNATFVWQHVNQPKFDCLAHQCYTACHSSNFTLKVSRLGTTGDTSVWNPPYHAHNLILNQNSFNSPIHPHITDRILSCTCCFSRFTFSALTETTRRAWTRATGRGAAGLAAKAPHGEILSVEYTIFASLRLVWLRFEKTWVALVVFWVLMKIRIPIQMTVVLLELMTH